MFQNYFFFVYYRFTEDIRMWNYWWNLIYMCERDKNVFIAMIITIENLRLKYFQSNVFDNRSLILLNEMKLISCSKI